MKRKLSLNQLIIASLAILFIFGCSKKDDSITTTPISKLFTKDTVNYIKLDNKKYEIAGAYSLRSSLFSGIHIYYTHFVTKGISFSDFLHDFIGKGSGFQININSASSLQFTGNYVVDTSFNPNFDVGEATGCFYINCNFYSNYPNSDSTARIHSGNYDIIKNQLDTFTVTGNFITTKNQPLKLYYRGAVTEIDVDYKKK